VGKLSGLGPGSIVAAVLGRHRHSSTAGQRLVLLLLPPIEVHVHRGAALEVEQESSERGGVVLGHGLPDLLELLLGLALAPASPPRPPSPPLPR
jgi:hypothetical protein